MRKMVIILIALLVISCAKDENVNNYNVDIKVNPNLSAFKLWLIQDNDTLDVFANSGVIYSKNINVKSGYLTLKIKPSVVNFDTFELNYTIKNNSNVIEDIYLPTYNQIYTKSIYLE